MGGQMDSSRKVEWTTCSTFPSVPLLSAALQVGGRDIQLHLYAFFSLRAPTTIPPESRHPLWALCLLVVEWPRSVDKLNSHTPYCQATSATSCAGCCSWRRTWVRGCSARSRAASSASTSHSPARCSSSTLPPSPSTSTSSRRRRRARRTLTPTTSDCHYCFVYFLYFLLPLLSTSFSS